VKGIFRISIARSAFLLVSLLPILALTARAQEPSGAGTDEPAAIAASAAAAADAADTPQATTAPDPAAEQLAREKALLDKVAEEEAQLREETRKLEAAQGEDRVVLLTQVWHTRETLLADLYDLVDTLLDRESAGLDAAEARKSVEATMLRVSQALRRHTDAQRAETARLRTARETVEPDKVIALEGDIARANERLDLLYSLALKHVRKLERIGLTKRADDDRQYLVEHLDEFAAELGSRIEYLRDEIARLRQQSAEFPDDAATTNQLQSFEQRLAARTTRLANTVKLMKQLGMDTAEYGQLIIQSTGKVTTDVFERKVALGLLQQAVDKARGTLAQNGPDWLFNLAAFVLIVLASRLFSRIARRLIERAMAASKTNLSRLLQSMIAGLAGNVVLVLGIMIGLGQLGVELGPLLAGLGIAGFIVGFALQETLGNFAAGVMILGYRPYDEGDVVEVGGVTGKVSNMNLVTTTILTFDNQELFVPNGKIWGSVIRNVTAQRIRRVDMEFSISYEDDVDRAREVLEEILKEHERVLDDPPPLVRLHKLAESSVDFVVRPWAKTVDYWEVYWDVTRAVKKRFDAEGISIPYPQRTVHLSPDSDRSDAA